MPDFHFRSLTPIVTGDHRKQNDRLLATGLLGSLRYQYWLMKSMEYWQAGDEDGAGKLALKAELDHQDDKDNPGDRMNLKEALVKAGPVVQLFGTTGWKRIFNLEINHAKKISERMVSAARPYEARAPMNWEFRLRFKQNRNLSSKIRHETLPVLCNPDQEIRKLMQFVHHFGWLGAAPQNGFGWVELLDPPAETPQPVAKTPFFFSCDMTVDCDEIEHLLDGIKYFYDTKKKSESDRNKKKRYKDSLTYVDVAKQCLADKKGVMPVGFEVRRFLKARAGEDAAFGSESQASHIHISHPVLRDGQARIRVRYCARPGNVSDDAVLPKRWVEWCNEVIAGSPDTVKP